MPLFLELQILEKLVQPQPLMFNAYDLNSFVSHPGNKRSSFIPSLSTGTMPNGLGSAVAPITPVNAVVVTNEVPQPTPTGATTFSSSGSLPIVSPIQNLGVPPTAQPAPWMRIPQCATNQNFIKRRIGPTLGLISHMQ